MYRPGSARAGAGRAAAPSRQPASGAAPPGGAAVKSKRMSLSDFEQLETISKGSFGVVFKAVRKGESLKQSSGQKRALG